MMKPLMIVLGLFFISGCGSEFFGKQENQRNDLRPALQGRWVSSCTKKVIHVVDILGDRATFEENTYFDPECVEKERTVKQSGSFNLAHTFKEGKDNSLVFGADSDVRVTLTTDYEVDVQNNTLAMVNNEKEQVIDVRSPTPDKKRIARQNEALRAAKAVTPWRRDEEKSLNRLQLEKLSGMGLQARPVVEQGTQAGVRYELDNGFLQLEGRVYTKK